MSAYRDFHFNYALHEKYKKELEAIYINGFEVLETPRRVTQFLRGELYIYVDSILSLFLNISTQELPAYYEFMSHVFMVIQLWLKEFPTKLYKSYQWSKKHPKLYLVDFDTALAKCGFELIEILGKCFGLCSRCLSLYKHFGTAYYFQGQVEAVPYFPERGFGFMYSLMNMFGELRGLESFKQFVCDGNPESGNSVIPIIYMDKLLQSLKYFYQRCNSSLASEILDMVTKAVTARLENITDKEIRELNPSVITSLFDTLRLYLARRNNYKTVEQLELIFIKKLLNCNKIEHKIKGLEELNKIKRKVGLAYNKEENKQLAPSEKADLEVYWITYDYLVSWVLNNEILETIFIESIHPEMIRRSYPIVSMLVREDKLNKVYLEIIWNNARDAHEDTVRATLELIQKLAAYLNMGSLQFVFKKVNEISNTDYDEFLLDFLKDYTFSAMKNYSHREREGSGNILQDAYKWLQTRKNSSERLKYFNLDKFWDIANDDQVTKTDIKEKAIRCLIEILGSPDCLIASKIHYLDLSINNIISGNKYIENCRLFKSIASKFNMTNQKESEAFHKINEAFGGLVTLIIHKHKEIVESQVWKLLVYLTSLGPTELDEHS